MSTTPFALRESLIDLMRKDLLGPANGPEEELDAQEVRLTDRYLVGALAPGGKIPFTEGSPISEHFDDDDDLDLNPESFIIAGPDGNDGSTDGEASLVDSLLPSSAGFTFLVDGAESRIAVHAGWGQYEAQRSEKDEDGRTKLIAWKRTPVKNAPIFLDLREGHGIHLFSEDYDIVLAHHIRQRDDLWYVSLFIVNCKKSSKRDKSGKRWIFQVDFSVESADGERRAIFVQRPALAHDLSLLDPDEKEELEDLALRYRHCGIFGKGRGCAIKAEKCTENSNRACRLSLDFLPVTTVPGKRRERKTMIRSLRISYSICMNLPSCILICSCPILSA